MNILYPDFLSRLITGEIELTGPNARSFKIALIQMDPTDEDCEIGRTSNHYMAPDGSPDAQSWGNFRYLQSIGAEVSDNKTGYTKGGLPLIFTGPFPSDKSKDGLSRLYFDCSSAFTWGSEAEPVNFTAYGACIYIDSGEGGEYDGLMLAWYEFYDAQTAVDGTFTIDFSKEHLISIKQDLYQVNQDSTIPTDDWLDINSNNPISNSAVTQALTNLGTRLGLKVGNSQGDPEKDLTVAEAINTPLGEDLHDDLDTINGMTREEIENIFASVINGSNGG